MTSPEWLCALLAADQPGPMPECYAQRIDAVLAGLSLEAAA